MELEELKERIYEEPCVVLPIGISGAGKSTLVEDIAEDEDQIVSSDHMRKRLTGDASNQRITGKAYSMVHQFVKNRCRHDCVTFVDATNLKPSDRKAVLSSARDEDESFKAIGILVESSEEKCKERQEDRDRQVPAHAIEKHAARYETTLGQIENERFQELFIYDTENGTLEEFSS